LFQLQSFCFYCLIVHACGLAVAGLAMALYVTADPMVEAGPSRSVVSMSGSQIPTLVASRRDDQPSVSPAVACTLALIGLFGLIGGQVVGPDSSTLAVREIEIKPAPMSPGQKSIRNVGAPDFMDNRSITAASDADKLDSGRLVSFAGLPHPIDTYAVPVLGARDAENVVVEMLDYTCTHCRDLHPRLMGARERYGDQFCIVLYHAPLSADCNNHLPPGKKGRPSACEYARLAISVWMFAPTHFTEYHNWLMEGRLPPPLAQAKQRAMQLAGNRVLLDDQLKTKITRLLRRQCDDWHTLDSGLPILLFGETAVQGGGKTEAELFAILEERLGLEPPASSDE
jgi:hypothetical protein